MNIDGNFDYIKPGKIIKGIYTYGFPPKGLEYDFLRKIKINQLSIEEFCEIYLKNISALAVGSEQIAEFYSKYINKNIYLIGSSYNENKFFPRNPNKFKKNSDDPLIIGWTGNPKAKFKGFYDIILPAIEFVKSKRNIIFKTRFEGPFNTLPSFFDDIELVIITSEADAGPSLYMEAALSGIPAISTNIGCAYHITQHSLNGLIINRSIDELVKNILYLYDNRTILNGMSKRIRNDFIEKLGKDILVQNWINMIEYTLQ